LHSVEKIKLHNLEISLKSKMQISIL